MINPGRLVVWVDGSLVGEHEARISPFDHGLLTGDGVFETLRVYRGEPYCWTRHYERLARSASGMGLAIPPCEALRRAALEVIDANGLTDARMRITLTGGPSPLGSERGRVTPTLILAGRTHLGVGGGITVDSDPAAEWQETELKAARLLAVAGAPEEAGVGGRIGVPA